MIGGNYATLGRQIFFSPQMHSKTSVAISSDFSTDRLWLNGIEESVESNPRLVNCLREVRSRATKDKVSVYLGSTGIYQVGQYFAGFLKGDGKDLVNKNNSPKCAKNINIK